MPVLAEPKSSVIVDGKKRITSKFTDGSELLEEYDVITDELVSRKRRHKNALGVMGEWSVEIGPSTTSRNLNKDFIVEANGSPELVLQNTNDAHIFRIRNLSYEKDNYIIHVEHKDNDMCGEIVIRTKNKKYYKRISIPEMVEANLPLEESSLSYEVKHNTLIVSYKKHIAILAAEAAAQKERASIPAKRIQNEVENGCAQQ